MPDVSNIAANLIIYMVVLLLAISAHEAAHAWMSWKYGDDTAYLLGRVTLNPVAHTDPIGTLLIPIVNFLAAGSGFFLIGWGKPTPVNPLRWRDKNKANVMVSLAGIMANILIAIIFFAIFKLLAVTGAGRFIPESMVQPVGILLYMAIHLNASLAVFNLLPFPPLDGSKVLYSVLPASMHGALDTLEQYGFILLLVVVYLGVVRAIYSPIGQLIDYLLRA